MKLLPATLDSRGVAADGIMELTVAFNDDTISFLKKVIDHNQGRDNRVTVTNDRWIPIWGPIGIWGWPQQPPTQSGGFHAGGGD